METIKKLQLNGVEYEFAGSGEFEALTDEEIDAICVPTTDTETKSIGEGLIVDEDGKLRLDPDYNFDHRYYTETEVDEKLSEEISKCSTKIVKTHGQKSTSVATNTQTLMDTYTIPTSGLYYVVAHLTAPNANDSTFVRMHMLQNNYWNPIQTSSLGGKNEMNASCIIECKQDDVLNLYAYHSFGSNLDLRTRFQVVQLMTE